MDIFPFEHFGEEWPMYTVNVSVWLIEIGIFYLVGAISLWWLDKITLVSDIWWVNKVDIQSFFIFIIYDFEQQLHLFQEEISLNQYCTFRPIS